MRRLAGQGAHGAGRALRILAEIALFLVILILGGALILAWRLDQGPLNLPWVAHRLEAAGHERGIDISVARVELRWTAFSSEADAPVELAILNARTRGTDRDGQPLASLARAEASFSLPALLLGRIVPRTVAIDGLAAQLARQADGRITLGLTPDTPLSMTEAVARAERGPPKAFGGRGPAWRRIRHAHIHDTRIAAYDAPLGVAWNITSADLDLDRDGSGGLTGHGAVGLAAGDQTASVTLTAAHAPGARTGSLRIAVTPINPARIAALSPVLDALGLLDAPVTAGAEVSVGRDLRPVRGQLNVAVASGTAHAGQGTAPLRGATVTLDATPDALHGTATVTTAASPTGLVTTIAATLHGTRGLAGYRAEVGATVDQLNFADLPVLWPKGVGGPGSRPWIVQNIPSGQISNGHLTLAASAPADLSTFNLDKIDASIDGHDVEVHWLRPIPPIIHGDARLTVTDPNVIDIFVLGARQAGGTQGGVVYRSGHVRISGINDPDQFADVDTDIAGPVADLLATLSHPRLNLLSRHPIPMHDPGGQVTARVHVGHLPLRDDVNMDDLAIATDAHFTNLHLGGIAAGHDLSDGDLTLSATNDGLRLGGRAVVAGFATSLQANMDFRAGPPDEITQAVQVSGTVTSDQLAQHGVDTSRFFSGSASLHAAVTQRRSGAGDIQAHADATDATLTIPGLGFTKPAGEATTGSVRATLQGDRLTSISEVRVSGPSIDVLGRADMKDGRPDLLRIERLRLGTGTDATGTLQLPHAPQDPYVVNVAGPSLDVSGPFQSALTRGKTASTAAGREPPFRIAARFDRVLLGEGRRIDAFSATVDNDGEIIRAAHASGTVHADSAASSNFSMAVEPQPSGRLVTGRVPNLGALLLALGVTDSIRGGALSLDGRFDDTSPSHPLSGRAVIDRFRVLDAPLVARILKAATLVGIVDLMRGPGVGFTKLVAPFGYEDGTLTLRNARVFSPTLGGTASGSIMLGARRLDLSGTVVPAYALNTLPGRIPLIGKLFSPEKSGGLFAAKFTLRGPFDNPAVNVNPLSVVAPGMLRDLFSLF